MRPGRSKQPRAALEQSPASPSQDAHTVTLSYSADTEPLQVAEGNARLPTSMQTPDPLDLKR